MSETCMKHDIYSGFPRMLNLFQIIMDYLDFCEIFAILDKVKLFLSLMKK